MKTAVLAGPIETPLPMNPASVVYPTLSSNSIREISDMFGYSRAKLSVRATEGARAMHRQRKASRRIVIVSLARTIRLLRKHLEDAEVHSERFVEECRRELGALECDLKIRILTRHH